MTREEAIADIRDNIKPVVGGISLDMAIEALEQQEKTAAWVPVDAEPCDIYECNACGWLLYYEDRTDFKYCPNCGARMVSE